MNRFAVIGNPIAHSLSPIIHQHFAEQFGIELSYKKIEGSLPNFEAQVLDFFASGGKGLNVTLPFKERAFAMVAWRTPRCERAHAANTLWSSANELYADNTDGIGLIRDLANYLDLTGKKVLLIGAGGAARGIIMPLFDAKIAELRIVNRTVEKAKQLSMEFPCLKTCSFDELKDSYDVIINATSASLTSDNLMLSPTLLHHETLCYDLAYNREKPTPFVAWARAQAVTAVDGLGMLVEQAAEAFFIWHNLRPETRQVIDVLHLT